MWMRVLSQGGQALAAAPWTRFDAATGGSIGRGIDCTLVLPDAQRLLSRRHALVSWRDGRWQLRRLGANLAVEIDGRPLALEAEAPLAPGMRIRIGPYLLETAGADPEAAAAPASSSSASEAAAAPAPVPRAAPRPEAAPAPRAGIFSDLLQDDARPAANAPSSALRPAPVPQAPAAASGAAVSEAPAPAPGLSPELLAALWAGLQQAAPAAPTPAQLQRVGSLLRTAVAGVLELLATRHIAKRELGAPGTRLQPRENNVLKFAPDADTALAHLLGPTPRGFIPPQAALREAFDDLRTHDIAMLAGLRAALESVLARLDPQALQARAHKGGWSPPLDLLRKAQLWDRYCAQYAQLRGELGADTDPLGGEAFLQAYEAQREKLAHPPGDA